MGNVSLRPGRRANAGFTLLEAVVTLVVVSMLVALLMQALNHALGLRTRLLRLQGESRVMLLQEAWFREAVAGAQPPGYGEGETLFSGTAGELSYASAAPLVARGRAPVRWWLASDADGHVALHYSDSAVDGMIAIPGPLQDASFSYHGVEGGWRNEWKGLSPNEAFSSGERAVQLLPRLVRFRAVTGSGRVLDWIVFLPSDLRAEDRIDPMEGGQNAL